MFREFATGFEIRHENDEANSPVPGLAVGKGEQGGFAEQVSSITRHDMPEIVAVSHA